MPQPEPISTLPPTQEANPQDQQLVVEPPPIQSAAPELYDDDAQMLSLDDFNMSDEDLVEKEKESTATITESEGEETPSTTEVPIEKEEVPSTDEPAPAVAETTPAADAKPDTTPAEPVVESALEATLADIFKSSPTTEPLKPDQRNFEGLAEEEKVLFKQMSNDAYNKLYPEILQLRQQAQNATVYNNPESYKLTPEYNQAVDEFSRLDTYTQHLEGQLMRPDNRFVPINQDANGNPVAGAEVEITEQDRMQVRQTIEQLKNQQNQYLTSVDNIKSQFQTQHSQRKNQVMGLLSKFDSESLRQDTPEYQSVNKYLSEMGLNKDILAPIVGVYHNKLVATLRENVALKQKMSSTSSLDAEQNAAGPTKAQSGGDQNSVASGPGNNEDYTAADMATNLAI